MFHMWAVQGIFDVNQDKYICVNIYEKQNKLYS